MNANHKPSSKYEIEHFADCILEDKEPLTSGAATSQGHRVIWRMYEAEKKNVIADLRGLALDDPWDRTERESSCVKKSKPNRKGKVRKIDMEKNWCIAACRFDGSYVICGLRAARSGSSASEQAQSSADGAKESASENSAGGETDGKRLKMGLSLYYRTDEYYTDIENCMKLEADKLGIDLIVQDANADLSKQNPAGGGFLFRKAWTRLLCRL